LVEEDVLGPIQRAVQAEVADVVALRDDGTAVALCDLAVLKAPPEYVPMRANAHTRTRTHRLCVCMCVCLCV
jgi:hypothetical protein